MRPAWPAGRSCHFSPRYSAICCSESASSSLCSVSRVRPWKSPQKLSCRSRTNTSNRCVLFLIRIGCRLLYRRFCCSSQQNLHPLSFYTLKITSPNDRTLEWLPPQAEGLFHKCFFSCTHSQGRVDLGLRWGQSVTILRGSCRPGRIYVPTLSG